MTSASSGLAEASRAELSAIDWEQLARRKIFFGHQSVGENIISGVQELVEHETSASLRIIAAARPGDVDGPALIHAPIGRNRDPSSKSTAFRAALADSAPDIALYKFCYVDIDAATDIDVVFAEYARTIEAVQATHPRLAIVHVTVPLTTAAPPRGIRSLIKRSIGRPPSAEPANNVRRNRYNALVRNRYAGHAPIFDLAQIESTRPDGSRSFFMDGAERVHTLAAELTTDGGHLNRLGQRAAAVGLLSILSRV